ncbi:MAG: DUF2057 family protein [Candidatus Desulfacyla sp.]
MKSRCMGIGFALFFSVLFTLPACTQKKTYTVGKPGDQSASLSFPSFIQIGNFDGDSVENIFTRILYEGKKELAFAAGTHTVELRYKDIWDIDDDDHEDVVSPYITLQFDARPNSAYEISVDSPKDRQSAHELASHFKAAIIDLRTKMAVSRRVEN